MTIFSPVKENMKSRVKGDFHARFCGKAGVRFPCLTRLATVSDNLPFEISMIKYFKTFFYPVTLIYSYNQPKEAVIAKIEKVLSRKVTFLGDNDMKGSFLSDDTFTIEMISFAYTNGVKYSSTLIGKVLEPQNGTTHIKIKAKPSFALYSLFFVTTIFVCSTTMSKSTGGDGKEGDC